MIKMAVFGIDWYVGTFIYYSDLLLNVCGIWVKWIEYVLRALFVSDLNCRPCPTYSWTPFITDIALTPKNHAGS